MEAIERLTQTVRISEDYAVGAVKARIIIIGLVFFGFVISGITEHSITVALSSEKSLAGRKEENETRVGRRYCDPPNMTALAIYYDSSEEAKDYDDGYDFSQLQEMLFEAIRLTFFLERKVVEDLIGFISSLICFFASGERFLFFSGVLYTNTDRITKRMMVNKPMMWDMKSCLIVRNRLTCHLCQTELTSEENMEIMLKKSYLWGTLVSPIAASQVVRNIGAKRVFGYSLLGSAAATLLVPAAWLTPSHVIIRFIQGLFNGALIPSCHTLAVNWFAPSSRSSFVSWYSGKYVGFAMTEVVTSQAVRTIGQDFIFHIIGLLTIIWFVMWSVLVYNTPEKNRNLSPEAKKQIKLEMGDSQSSTNLDIPWRHILGSRPVWMSIGAIFGSHCGQSTTNIGIRQYLKFVYNVSDSLLSAAPFLTHSLFALLCGYTVDMIHKTGFVSVTSSRRMFVYISHFLTAGFIFVVSFVGCDVTAPIALYSLSIIASGAIYSGALCSTIDISPNFCGTIIGLCCTFAAGGDLLVTYVISQVLDGEVLGSWRITFSLTALILLITSIFFMLRGSGSIQMWNDLANAEKASPVTEESAVEGNSDSVPAMPKLKNKVSVEEKILKVLYVQEPERFTRVRAYSTSLPNETAKMNPRIPQLRLDKKRASIS